MTAHKLEECGVMVWYNEFPRFNPILIHSLIQFWFFMVVLKYLKATVFSVDLPNTFIDFQIHPLTCDWWSLSFCILQYYSFRTEVRYV